jgi:hypothetical protein
VGQVVELEGLVQPQEDQQQHPRYKDLLEVIVMGLLVFALLEVEAVRDQ